MVSHSVFLFLLALPASTAIFSPCFQTKPSLLRPPRTAPMNHQADVAAQFWTSCQLQNAAWLTPASPTTQQLHGALKVHLLDL